MIFGRLLNPKQKIIFGPPLKSRPNQKGRAETEEKCYLDSFSTSPHLAGTSPPPETTELAGDEEKQREEDSHLGKEDKRK